VLSGFLSFLEGDVDFCLSVKNKEERKKEEEVRMERIEVER
jgi:hypothetical protein